VEVAAEFIDSDVDLGALFTSFRTSDPLSQTHEPRALVSIHCALFHENGGWSTRDKNFGRKTPPRETSASKNRRTSHSKIEFH
jgi:hypothetical protein